MCRQNHGVAVDYFAVGVIAFECMFGRVLLKSYSLETICRQDKTGNKRPYFIKVNTD